MYLPEFLGVLICYVDEAGCTGTLPAIPSNIQPLTLVTGVIIDEQALRDLTMDLLHLKARFFPRLRKGPHFLNWVFVEVKGAELRRDVALGDRRERRSAIGFLDRLLALMERCDARLIGRAWIKSPGASINGTALYTSSIQALCAYFNDLLTRRNEFGIMIADSRTKFQNLKVVEAMFTQKYRAAGDRYDRILDVVTFGHGGSHGGVQIADLVCSAFLFPMAVNAYCEGHIPSPNCHVRPTYRRLRTRYAYRLRALQHRYQDSAGHWRGGIVVADPIASRSSARLFQP